MTPGLSFGQAEDVLKNYWFSGFVHPDFSPTTTVIRFPDGYSVEYHDVDLVPPVTHTLNKTG